MRSIGGVGNTFHPPLNQQAKFVITGVTRDGNGNGLGGCTVQIFETVSGLLRGVTISDASGNYLIELAGDPTLTFYAVGMFGATQAGTTINTLVGAYQ